MSKSEETLPAFDAISPVFPVSDVAAALSFYRERLGFAIGWTWGEPPTHANVCRGAIAINLTLEPSEAGGAEAYVELRGIDNFHAELRARGVSLGDLDDRAYGMRDFALFDPDGNRIVFGEPVA